MWLCSAQLVLPSIQYWKQLHSDQKCVIGNYIVKVGGVQAGKESNGKIVDTKIVFFGDRDKVVCQFYNTTQRTLINGHGYKKFIELFLKPFFTSKIDNCEPDIKAYNEFVRELLGSRSVKRSSVKYKGGTTFPCNRCEFAAKN